MEEDSLIAWNTPTIDFWSCPGLALQKYMYCICIPVYEKPLYGQPDSALVVPRGLGIAGNVPSSPILSSWALKGKFTQK